LFRIEGGTIVLSAPDVDLPAAFRRGHDIAVREIRGRGIFYLDRTREKREEIRCMVSVTMAGLGNGKTVIV